MGYSPQGHKELDTTARLTHTHNQLYQCFLTAAWITPKKPPPQ